MMRAPAPPLQSASPQHRSLPVGSHSAQAGMHGPTPRGASNSDAEAYAAYAQVYAQSHLSPRTPPQQATSPRTPPQPPTSTMPQPLSLPPAQSVALSPAQTEVYVPPPSCPPPPIPQNQPAQPAPVAVTPKAQSQPAVAPPQRQQSPAQDIMGDPRFRLRKTEPHRPSGSPEIEPKWGCHRAADGKKLTPASPPSAATQRNLSFGSRGAVADQSHLSTLQQMLAVNRNEVPKGSASFQAGCAALWKADDAKKSNNVEETLRQYEVCINHLLTTSMKGDKPKKLQRQVTPTEPLQLSSYCTTIDFINDIIEMHERLGSGGSGAIIYRCTCAGLSFVAKIMATDIVPELRDTLVAEINVMHSLNHPNIVKYLGHDLSKPNEVRLYMEFYTDTLHSVIAKQATLGGYFSFAELTNFAFQLAKGLKYLHSIPIIHRDLKSENVFITKNPQGQIQALKIGDFDTAKILEAAKNTFTKNTGTVGYMAPEVCVPTGKGYTSQVDIWYG
eukprot:TRINITY_DN59_c0_g1_i16.p1 TRINITY_DN59_c0_g1~~TRINITY_DN59_c0_g1_i16.p1  ORF type:complete len:561 (-),score=153.89 TRINITY_DN59_c0_g1_i16:422-1924(-)